MPVVLHREAALRDRGLPARRRPRVRPRHRGRVPAVPARSDRPAGHDHAGGRGLRPQVRRTGTGRRDHRDITAVAAAEGLEFHLERAQRANTRDAHRTLWYALAYGSPGTQAALKERLLAAYFTDGKNIADHGVLAAEAGGVGLDPDDVVRMLESADGTAEVTAALSLAAEAGITAVPTYVIDGRWSIPGAQDPDVFVQVLRRLADRAERAG